MDKKKEIKIVKRLSFMGFMFSVGAMANDIWNVIDLIIAIGNFTFFVMAIWEETNEFRR